MLHSATDHSRPKADANAGVSLSSDFAELNTGKETRRNFYGEDDDDFSPPESPNKAAIKSGLQRFGERTWCVPSLSKRSQR